MKHLNKLRVALCAAAVVVAVAFFACNKEKETATQQPTEVEAARKPIATFDNATGQMTYHFDTETLQLQLNEQMVSRSISNRYIVESVEVLDKAPTDESVYAEIKVTILDVETESTITAWLMHRFTDKKVRQDMTDYYSDTEVASGNYDFGYRSDGKYYMVSVNGDNLITTEIDSTFCMTLPRPLLTCMAQNCGIICEKQGSWWHSQCKPCESPADGKCNDSFAPWAAITVSIVSIVLGLIL